MYDRIYTIGCFDYFHDGHRKLLKSLRSYGSTLIVGIHDDASLEKLKTLRSSDHQPLETRIQNVKRYADHVYVIPSTDPTPYLKAMIRPDDNINNACYIRGDDMPNFPGKKVIERKLAIRYLPYQKGVSSTHIRKEKAQYDMFAALAVVLIWLFLRYIE